MRRTERSIKITVTKCGQSQEWTQGEQFNFKSLSPKYQGKKRRDTIVAPTKNVKQLSPKQMNRKSYALKRLEVDLTPKVTSSPVSKRTRRQSMASLSHINAQKNKSQMQRAKSDKVIGKGSLTSSSSSKPSLKISPDITLSRVDRVSSKPAAKGKDKLPIQQSTKSSTRTRPMRRNLITRESMTKLVEAKLPSPPASKANVNPSEETKRRKKQSPPKSKLPLRSASKPDAKSKTKTPAKSKAKPLKRLSVATPSQLPQRRSTRSSGRKAVKKVHIFAQSPAGSEVFRRTPKTSGQILDEMEESYPDQKSIYIPTSRKKLSPKSLNPFTPKLVEPSKLLKQTMKKKVASELRGFALSTKNVSVLLDADIVTVTKSSAKTPGKTPERKSQARRIEETSVTEFELPVTPVSSRKSILKEDRFRSSRRQTYSLRFPNNSPSSDKPLSSTPVKKALLGVESMLDDIDISGVSNTSGESDFTASFTKSFSSSTNVVSMVEEKSVDEVENSPQATQPNKKSYCTVM